VAAPVSICKDGDIYFLELDTPGSSVNIFSRATAEQISQFMRQLQPNDASLIVFKSTKPYSFLNGTELVLTASARTLEDATTLSQQTRQAYRAIEQCPIPTVSAIQGSCFGCGVEFALCTDYRLAADSFDTCFYMTELRDYYFPPIFGALEKLPRLLGLCSAVDFLLWGEKWRAPEAQARNLIDRVLPGDDFDSSLRDFLSSGALKGLPKRPVLECPAQASANEAADSDQIRHRIGRLPPEQRGLYGLCFEAMLESLRSPYSSEFVRKSTAAFRSVFQSDAWRRATSFFFIRTMSRAASLGTSSLIPSDPVTLRLPATALECMSIFGGPRLKGLTVHRDETAARPELIGKNAVPLPFDVRWGYAGEVRSDGRPLLYFPGGESCDVCEIFLAPQTLQEFRSLLVLITHLGWQPIVRSIDGKSALNALIEAGVHSLWEVHHEAQHLLRTKVLRHSSQVDVAVRALFNFPLCRGSFMSHFEGSSRDKRADYRRGGRDRLGHRPSIP
jgi:enoyl-CoA hydratase/carnithine racemase